jgi:hypothetical protein
MIMRGIAHRLVKELDAAAGALEFLQQEHLVDVVASQPVRGGDEDAVVVAESHLIAQAVEGGAVERGAARAPHRGRCVRQPLPHRVRAGRRAAG